MEHKYRSLKKFKPCVTVLALVAVMLFSFPDSGLSRQKRQNRDHRIQDLQKYDKKMHSKDRDNVYLLDNKYWSYAPLDVRNSYPLLVKNYRNRYNRLSPEEKNMLKERYREWESLPEHKQQMLRHRMEKYKRLPPQERERYQHRYRQLQKLPPEERYEIREKLQKWERLPPDEKERIRQRFRKP